jgi:hypothetical protein
MTLVMFISADGLSVLPQAQQNTYVPILTARLESLVQAVQLDELLVLYSWVRIGL